MRLSHAIRRIEQLLATPRQDSLAPEDIVAMHVLLKLAKRAERLQRPLRQLDRAINGDETDLNQESLFDE